MIYFIRHTDNNIKVSIYDTLTESFEVLKNKGEAWQEYNDDFWHWFKKKIDYKDESLSFAILHNTDNKDKVQIPSDIKISKTNYITQDTQAYNLIESQADITATITFIPIFKINKKQNKVTKPIQKQNEIKQDSITHYYKQKTKTYQEI